MPYHLVEPVETFRIVPGLFIRLGRYRDNGDVKQPYELFRQLCTIGYAIDAACYVMGGCLTAAAKGIPDKDSQWY